MFSLLSPKQIASPVEMKAPAVECEGIFWLKSGSEINNHNNNRSNTDNNYNSISQKKNDIGIWFIKQKQQQSKFHPFS